jgi:hypothetical protein
MLKATFARASHCSSRSAATFAANSVKVSLSSLIRERLDKLSSGIVHWSDTTGTFQSFVENNAAKLGLRRITRINVFATRLELGSDPGIQHGTLYSTSADGLEPIEEIVQCYSRTCTLTIEDLLSDCGIERGSSHTILSRQYPTLLIAMWDRVGKFFWESGDIDLGIGLAHFQRERGDEVDLALCVLEAAAKPMALDLKMDPTDIANIGQRFVPELLGRRLGLPEAASVDDLVTALVVSDLASTRTGNRLVGHLVSALDHVKVDSCLNALAREPKLREALSDRYDRVLHSVGIKVDDLDIGDLVALRFSPGVDQLLADRLDAKINKAGDAEAFHELRAVHELRRRSLTPYTQALAFDDAITKARSMLAEDLTLEDFFIKYVSDWAQIDRLYRKIEGLIADGLQRAVETRYRLWLQDLTIAFTNRLEKRSAWKFKNSQRALGESFVKTDSKSAILISDALRYEMAQDLYDRIPKATRVLDWAIASLPTKTEVGMSALLPTEGPLHLSVVNRALVVRVGKRITTDKPARDAAWKAAGYTVLSDWEARSADTGALERVVVFHGSLDALGEKLQAKAFDHYEAIVEELARLVTDLVKRGFRVTVTADHGFLTLPPNRLGSVASGASEEAVVKRRYSVDSSEPLAAGPRISRSASDLGMEGDVTVSFPAASSIFAAHGANVFVHGGLSLQEMTIPVLVAESKAALAQAGHLSVSFPKRLRSRVVAVNVAREGAERSPIRLRFVARAGGREVNADSEFKENERTLRLSLTLPEDLPDGPVELSIMVDAGRVIDRRSVEYEAHD